MTQSICVPCKVRSGQGRLRPLATEVHRPRLWREGSAAPGPPASAGGLSSALQGEERNEPGEDDGKGCPTACPPPPGSLASPGLAGAGRAVALLSQLRGGLAAGCMNAVVLARGADQSPRSPIGSCRDPPTATPLTAHALYSSAWKVIKPPVHAPRGPVCLCCGAKGPGNCWRHMEGGTALGRGGVGGADRRRWEVGVGRARGRGNCHMATTSCARAALPAPRAIGWGKEEGRA